MMFYHRNQPYRKATYKLGKYLPHQGKRERLRRVMQMTKKDCLGIKGLDY